MTNRSTIPDAQLVDGKGMVEIVWAQLFTLWGVTITAIRQAGPTANRPTKGLWPGRQYMDLTLGKPVFVKTVSPLVWVDGAGVVS